MNSTSSMPSKRDAILTRIHKACESSKRSPNDVTLVWVSKTKARSAVDEALDAGAIHFGENRMQEAVEKFSNCERGEVLHLIGPVQSNKLRKAAAICHWIHSMDSHEKISKLEQICAKLDRNIKVLIQVNISGEISKNGVPLEEASDFLDSLPKVRHIEYRGLMGIGPFTGNPENARDGFTTLRKLRDQFFESAAPHLEKFSELSMGMSADLEVAISEGSTMIRIGTDLFGTRG